MTELIGVIILLAIVAVIAAPSIFNFINRSDLQAKRVIETRMLESTEAYYETRGSIPTVEYGLIQYDSLRRNCFIDVNTKNYIDSSKSLCEVDVELLKEQDFIKNDVDDGTYHIFYDGNKIKVSYDIPVEYIEVLTHEYKAIHNAYPLKSGQLNNLINVTQLELPYSPSFEYILLDNGVVERLIKE